MGNSCGKQAVGPVTAVTPGTDPAVAPAPDSRPAASGPPASAAPTAKPTAVVSPDTSAAPAAAPLPTRAEVGAWSVERVGSHLQALGLGQYSEALAENDVDGALLLTLTDTDLEEAGMPSGLHRKKLLGWISRLEAGDAAPAPAPSADGGGSAFTKVEKPTDESASLLASFVCNSVVARYLSDRQPLAEPEDSVFAGAIFFADLAGFTALCESMVHERVSAHLSRIFGEMADAIADHGGDVMKFAGDAVIALFGSPADGAPTDDLQLRANMAALQCALHFAAHMNTHEADDVTLTMHLGVVGGPLQAMHVGGHNGEWEFLVTGRPFQDLDSCVSASAHGEVVTSPDVWRTVAPHMTGSPMDCGMYHITSVKETIAAMSNTMPSRASLLSGDPELVDLVQRYVPTIVRAKASASSVDWIGELRTMSILFVAIGGLKLSFYPDGRIRESAKLQSAIRIMQSCTLDHGGFIRQFAVDDKGTVLVAGWGVAPCAYEDDGARAILTALEITKRLEAECKLKANCGVTTGEVYCGTVGSHARQEYCMVGDKVNLSARLMKASGGGVLCCANTLAAVQAGQQGAIQFLDPQPAPIRVKGKRDLVTIARPLDAQIKSPTRARRRRSKLTGEAQQALLEATPEPYGRGAAVAQLTARISALCSGHPAPGACVEIAGPPGAGKSHLLTYAERLALDQGAVCVTGVAAALGPGTKYSLWRGVFHALLGLDDVPAVARAGHVMGRVLELSDGEDTWMDSAWLLGAVLGVPMAPPVGAAETPGTVRAEVTSQLAMFVLTQTAQRGGKPIFIGLDSVHHADSLSQDLIMAAATVPGVLVVYANDPSAAARTAASLATGGNLAGHAAIERISLDPLDREHLVDMLKSELGVPAIPDAVVDLVMEHSAGNALYAQCVVAAMRDQGIVAVSDGALELTGDVAALDVPGELQQLITARLSQLDELARLTLKVACILPEEFDDQLLAGVFPPAGGTTAEQVADAVRRLEADHLLRRTGAGLLAMSDAMTRAAVFGLLLAKQKKELNARVAAFLQSSENADAYASLADEWLWRYKLGAMGVDLDDLANAPTEDLDHEDVVDAIERLQQMAEQDLEALAMDGYEKADLALGLVLHLLADHEDQEMFLAESLDCALRACLLTAFATFKIPITPDFRMPCSGLTIVEAIDMMEQLGRDNDDWDVIGKCAIHLLIVALFFGETMGHPGDDPRRVQPGPMRGRCMAIVDELKDRLEAGLLQDFDQGTSIVFQGGWLVASDFGMWPEAIGYARIGLRMLSRTDDGKVGKYLPCSGITCSRGVNLAYDFVTGESLDQLMQGVAYMHSQDHFGTITRWNAAYRSKTLAPVAFMMGDRDLMNEAMSSLLAPGAVGGAFGDMGSPIYGAIGSSLKTYIDAKEGARGEALAGGRGMVDMMLGMLPADRGVIILFAAAGYLISGDHAAGWAALKEQPYCTKWGGEVKRMMAELAAINGERETADTWLADARALCENVTAIAVALRCAVTQAKLLAQDGDAAGAEAHLAAALEQYAAIHDTHPVKVRALALQESKDWDGVGYLC